MLHTQAHYELLQSAESRAAQQAHLIQGYTLELILEALRRDMRHQEELSHTDSPYAHIAGFQARKDKDLLEMLNPKHANPFTHA